MTVAPQLTRSPLERRLLATLGDVRVRLRVLASESECRSTREALLDLAADLELAALVRAPLERKVEAHP